VVGDRRRRRRLRLRLAGPLGVPHSEPRRAEDARDNNDRTDATLHGGRRMTRMCHTAARPVERRLGAPVPTDPGETLARCEASKAKCTLAPRARQGSDRNTEHGFGLHAIGSSVVTSAPGSTFATRASRSPGATARVLLRYQRELPFATHDSAVSPTGTDY